VSAAAGLQGCGWLVIASVRAAWAVWRWLPYMGSVLFKLRVLLWSVAVVNCIFHVEATARRNVEIIAMAVDDLKLLFVSVSALNSD
jgi:hypothetical protein